MYISCLYSVRNKYDAIAFHPMPVHIHVYAGVLSSLIIIMQAIDGAWVITGLVMARQVWLAEL